MADRTDTEEYKKAAARVTEEFQLLLHGMDENVPVGEFFMVREYADRRTDLLANENELTDTELAWKRIYESVDKQVSQTMEASRKKEVDKLADIIRAQRQYQKVQEAAHELLKEIEFLLVVEYSHLMVHFDKGEKNKYKKEEEQLARIAADERAEPSLRVQAAESILKWADQYKETYVSMLKQDSEKIYNSLQEFDKYLHNMDDIIDLLRALGKSESGLKAFTEDASEKEWFSLVSDLYLARTMAIFSIERSLEADRIIPNFVIQTEGKQSKMEKGEIEIFKNKVVASGSLEMTASKKEDELQKKLAPLVKNLWPEKDKEIEERAQAYSIAS